MSQSLLFSRERERQEHLLLWQLIKALAQISSKLPRIVSFDPKECNRICISQSLPQPPICTLLPSEGMFHISPPEVRALCTLCTQLSAQPKEASRTENIANLQYH